MKMNKSAAAEHAPPIKRRGRPVCLPKELWLWPEKDLINLAIYLFKICYVLIVLSCHELTAGIA